MDWKSLLEQFQAARQNQVVPTPYSNEFLDKTDAGLQQASQATNPAMVEQIPDYQRAALEMIRRKNTQLSTEDMMDQMQGRLTGE